MDMQEAYSFLFTDSLMGTLVLPPHAPYVFRAMLTFGSYSPIMVVVLAGLGSLAGVMLNWALGRALATVRDKEWVIMDSEKLDSFTAFFRRYFSWLLILAWIPGLGSVITVVAGACKVRWWVALLWAGLGVTAYFAWVLTLI